MQSTKNGNQPIIFGLPKLHTISVTINWEKIGKKWKNFLKKLKN
jgi:hypothetical protein